MKNVTQEKQNFNGNTGGGTAYFGDESWSFLTSTIQAARDAIQIGTEYAQELLIEHDAALGRTTRTNKATAERLEAEIKIMKATIKKLATPDGLPYRGGKGY